MDELNRLRYIETRLVVLSSDIKELSDSVNRLTSYLRREVETNAELLETVSKYVKAELSR